MPDSVEMPAPVSTTIERASVIHSVMVPTGSLTPPTLPAPIVATARRSTVTTPTAPRLHRPRGESLSRRARLHVVGRVTLLEQRERDATSRRRASAIGGSARRASAQAACSACTGAGRRRRLRRWTGGRLRRTATVVKPSLHASSKVRAAPTIGRSASSRPSRSPRPSARRVGDGELDAARVLVELRRKVPQEEQGSGPESRQPEPLDVARTRIVAHGVEDRVGPGLDGERRGHAGLLGVALRSTRRLQACDRGR